MFFICGSRSIPSPCAGGTAPGLEPRAAARRLARGRRFGNQPLEIGARFHLIAEAGIPIGQVRKEFAFRMIPQGVEIRAAATRGRARNRRRPSFNSGSAIGGRHEPRGLRRRLPLRAESRPRGCRARAKPPRSSRQVRDPTTVRPSPYLPRWNACPAWKNNPDPRQTSASGCFGSRASMRSHASMALANRAASPAQAGELSARTIA